MSLLEFALWWCVASVVTAAALSRWWRRGQPPIPSGERTLDLTGWRP